jgi:diaminohydroxyphosphoribosylaminopyrimidine deaminase/5-amino-6-(5-phosphoribosylamino)uracil reductase
MFMALEEAKKGDGRTLSNPLVGCVILDRNRKLLSVGYHKRFGGPHAEIEALNQISPDHLTGAHLYVTLEPCAHEGKTPSCAKRLVQLPLASVTYGVMDPNPLVSGAGIKIIQDAGISTFHLSEMESACKKVAEVFFTNQTLRRPFVALKVATSLDGIMALKDGTSQWITNDASRLYGHKLRARYGSVIVGANTVLRDDPSLNVRHPDYKDFSNKVVILDLAGDLPNKILNSKLLKVHKPENLIILSPLKPTHSILQNSDWIFFDGESSNLDQVLREVYKLGVYGLLIEGGAKTYNLFWRAKLVDRVYNFQAPCIVGRGNGISWTDEISISELNRKVLVEMDPIEELS